MIAIVTIAISLFTCTSCGTPVYTVHFETGTSDVVVADIDVNDGKILDEPTKPYRDGYTFEGWYVDSELKIPYDFNKPIKSSFTLYAKWSEISQDMNTFGIIDVLKTLPNENITIQMYLPLGVSAKNEMDKIIFAFQNNTQIFKFYFLHMHMTIYTMN